MICAKCGTENPEGAKFCMNCASSLESLTGLDQETRLQTLQQSAPRGLQKKIRAARPEVVGERKPVTIMFVDIAGSTTIAEKLDPEDWREIVAGAHKLVSEAIYRFEGTITQLLGDGVYAFFGAPLTHEDDPARACLAALDIQEAIRDYREELGDSIEDFQIRVGIHTGEVVIGDIGTDLHVEYLAFGDAVNVAARLESAAEPGTVMVSEATHKLIAPAFEFVDLDKIQVKGKEEPIKVFRVVKARTRPEKLRGIEGLDSPLVGREGEYQALIEALERLQAGLGGITTIVGEAGLGKSRLVAELRAQNAEMDLNWIEGRCLSYGGTIPYQLWLDALRELLEVQAEDSSGVIQEKLKAKIKELCPDQFKNIHCYLGNLLSLPLEEEFQDWILDQDGERVRAGTFEAIEAIISRTSQQQPLVLVCEDLHWADPTSIQLLKRILELTEEGQLLVICIFRPEKDHISWSISEIAAERYPERHNDQWIHPLSSSESEEMVGNIVGVEGLPGELKDRILSRAEGNPFYVEEIIRSLIDRYVLVLDESTGDWVATSDIGDIVIPDTLHGVLLARIDRLQQDTKRVLQMASVIGRIFLYRVLGAMAVEERSLSDHLAKLQGEEMIRERRRIPELEYIFKHHLTQEAAYNGLLKKERKSLHRMVAEAFEELFPERIEELLGILAFHWERAEEGEVATKYLLRAGDQARMAFANEEAVQFYQRALALQQEEGHDDQAARTLMKLGLTHHASFDFESAGEAWGQGLSLWRQASMKETIAPIPAAPHALRSLEIEPKTLDPNKCEDSFSALMIRQTFSGLVESSPDNSILPDMAQSWEVQEGGTRYIFHLREDARWTDGTPVTAGDFEYSWKRAVAPSASFVPIYFYDIKGARAYHQGELSDPDLIGIRSLDKRTLQVDLEQPASYLLHLLTNVVPLFPIPRHVVERYGEAWTEIGNIVTNGPFRLESWREGETMVLVRNEDYHGWFTGNLKRVEIQFRDAGDLSGTEAYKADELDVLFNPLIQADMDGFVSRLQGDFVTAPLLSTFSLCFDTTQPPFNDPGVRRAIALSMDKVEGWKSTRRSKFDNTSPATGGFVPPGLPGHSPDISKVHNPQEARNLLAEAGYPEGRDLPIIEVIYAYSSEEINTRIERAWASQWKDILGIESKWEFLDWEAILKRKQSKRPAMFTAAWMADYPDPDNFLRSGLPLGTGWQNDAFEALIGRSRKTLDHNERITLLEEADKILMEEMPFIPLVYWGFSYFVKPWVRRFFPSWKYIIIDPH